MSLLQEFFIRLPHNLGPDGALRGENLHNSLCLKPNNGLSEDRMIHTTGTRPRHCALLNLQTKEIQTLNIGLFPV